MKIPRGIFSKIGHPPRGGWASLYPLPLPYHYTLLPYPNTLYPSPYLLPYPILIPISYNHPNAYYNALYPSQYLIPITILITMPYTRTCHLYPSQYLIPITIPIPLPVTYTCYHTHPWCLYLSPCPCLCPFLYPLPITHYPLPITHYPLPITHYPLP